tara:strand:- start:1181 stop:1636 length:456 start_codon:yes stop_codon:yes gene_type:complete
MKGSCLCGGILFEINEIVGPFELCHCTRCRKATGSAYAAFLEVKTDGFRILEGRELFKVYQAPIFEKPPCYENWFCIKCGSRVPDPNPEGKLMEVPAGLFDEPIHVVPDKHIYVDLKSDWDEIDRVIPKFTKDEIRTFREKHGRAAIQQGA